MLTFNLSRKYFRALKIPNQVGFYIAAAYLFEWQAAGRARRLSSVIKCGRKDPFSLAVGFPEVLLLEPGEVVTSGSNRNFKAALAQSCRSLPC
jgi:hypothetical protein